MFSFVVWHASAHSQPKRELRWQDRENDDEASFPAGSVRTHGLIKNSWKIHQTTLIHLPSNVLFIVITFSFNSTVVNLDVTTNGCLSTCLSCLELQPLRPSHHTSSLLAKLRLISTSSRLIYAQPRSPVRALVAESGWTDRHPSERTNFASPLEATPLVVWSRYSRYPV